VLKPLKPLKYCTADHENNAMITPRDAYHNLVLTLLQAGGERRAGERWAGKSQNRKTSESSMTDPSRGPSEQHIHLPDAHNGVHIAVRKAPRSLIVIFFAYRSLVGYYNGLPCHMCALSHVFRRIQSVVSYGMP
jgi:hypothetical protein